MSIGQVACSSTFLFSQAHVNGFGGIFNELLDLRLNQREELFAAGFSVNGKNVSTVFVEWRTGLNAMALEKLAGSSQLQKIGERNANLPTRSNPFSTTIHLYADIAGCLIAFADMFEHFHRANSLQQQRPPRHLRRRVDVEHVQRRRRDIRQPAAFAQGFAFESVVDDE